MSDCKQWWYRAFSSKFKNSASVLEDMYGTVIPWLTVTISKLFAVVLHGVSTISQNVALSYEPPGIPYAAKKVHTST